MKTSEAITLKFEQIAPSNNIDITKTNGVYTNAFTQRMYDIYAQGFIAGLALIIKKVKS